LWDVLSRMLGTLGFLGRVLSCNLGHLAQNQLKHFESYKRKLNLLMPNVNYSGRTAPLTSKVTFYIQGFFTTLGHNCRR